MGQALHGVDGVSLDEAVDVRHGRGHTPGQRCVARGHFQGVHPDRSKADSLQSAHLLGQHLGFAAIPTIAEHHHDRAASHAPHAPFVVEATQTFAQAGATTPVLHPMRRQSQRLVGVARAQLTGDTGEAGTNGEGFHLLTTSHRRLHEPQQGAGIRLHRPRHVEQQNESPQTLVVLQMVTGDGFAGSAQAGANRAPQIGSSTSRSGGQAERGTGGAHQSEPRHHFLSQVKFLGGVGGEVLGAQRFDGGKTQGDRTIVVIVGGVRLAIVHRSLVGIDVDRQMERLDFQIIGCRASLIPEHLERPIEQRDVLGATNEGGPAGPVDVVASIDAES